MRSLLALVFLLSAQPALAACHHYSAWHYPWPQSCRLTPARVHHARFEAPPAPTPDIDPILIPPGWDEEQERRDAVETLKTELQQGGK